MRQRAAHGNVHRLGNGMNATMFAGPPLGPGMVTASQEEVLAALGRFDPNLSWTAAASIVIPMLPRARAYPVAVDDRLTVQLPPGLDVGFGLDIGPAVAFVGERNLAAWGVDRAELVSIALDNVRRLIQDMRPSQVVHSVVDEVPVRIVQTGQGIASTLVLAPDVLPRLLGDGPHLLAAPMRDILIALPSDADPEFAAWLSGELAGLDPNGLHLGLFRHAGGRVIREPVGRTSARETSVVNLMH